MEAGGGELGQAGLQERAFLLTPCMAGVEGDYHHTARFDEFQGLFKGGKG
jgi:hypothetical protein